ncbi:Nramp family divalent metal transporter [Sphingomonas oligophenolica]|uniref:Divalent metal cation transporter MntH n=1 Tax=Sphingomonas oligophenolica TaxID=301154 RepID=A0A502CEU7_9SPHN|nr:Nramp family divalent metal transporter [Sphingomonas oligophenolica]TPG12225.1 divalent metal cation transporter [Sphingomonas oligophenolica]
MTGTQAHEPDTDHPGWRGGGSVSLPEAFRSIAVPEGANWWRKLAAFTGPGFLVAVGYMDPGNWATDLAGGSAFGYTLLSVILLSNVMAIILQALSARLGIATGRDLASACRDAYSRPTAIMLWLLCEVAIVACDLAEVIGTAIGLNLLFGIPLVWGVCLTGLDVLLILMLQRHGFRRLEAFIMALIAIIALCFLYELIASRPEIGPLLAGFVPRSEVITNPTMLYLAIGILGATVMPHNLYLHSATVQTRAFERTPTGKRDAAKWATIDSTVALSLALFVNAAILILAASAFHTIGRTDVAEIQDAYQLLSPTLGAAAASTIFAVALLASGQNSTITATLAGQIVMEGFVRLRLAPWLRRLVTRGIAIVPTVIVAALYGESGTARLLILSQVVLSMQLPFAIVPLVRFTSDKTKMGNLVSPTWLKVAAWGIAAIIIVLNAKLLLDTTMLGATSR